VGERCLAAYIRVDRSVNRPRSAKLLVMMVTRWSLFGEAWCLC